MGETKQWWLQPLKNHRPHKTTFYFLWTLWCFSLIQGCSLPLPQPPTEEIIESNKEFKASYSVIAEVLMRIQLDYVDLHYLDAEKLLDSALVELSRDIPEIQTNLQTTKDEFLVQMTVKHYRHEFSVKSLNNLEDLNRTIKLLYWYLYSHKEVLGDLKEVRYALIEGLLRETDPHSAILPVEDYSEFKISTGGNFGGVGMMIGIRDNQLTVIAPIDDTPAARAGIKSGDRVVRIDDEDTANISLTDTVNKLRGEKGSVVVVYIMRTGFTEPKKIELVRDIIQINSVESSDILSESGMVRYLRIKSFQENTYDELLEKLENLENVKGFILDLRNNPGGLLEQAIRISETFLPPNKPIVSTVSSQEEDRESYQSNWVPGRPELTDTPLMILINNGSASASEIVTAALKNNDRALVIGEKSFGKGSVQSVWELEDSSALKLTTAKYLTPGDRSIQSVGVTPHIAFDAMVIKKDQILIFKREEDYYNKGEPHYFKEWGTPPDKSIARVSYLADDEESPDEDTDLSGEQLSKFLKKDFLVQFAQTVLQKKMQDAKRPLLDVALETRTVLNQVQEQKIIDGLAAVGVDWKTYPDSGASALSMTVKVQMEQIEGDVSQWIIAPEVIPVGKKIRVIVDVKNEGTLAVDRLFGITKSDNDLFDYWELPFGHLIPGATQSWTLPISVPQYLRQSISQISIDVQGTQKQSLIKKQFFLKFEQTPPPQFEFKLKVVDDGSQGSKGNGNGKMEMGETIALQVELKNIGKGLSEETAILLKKETVTVPVILKEGRQKLSKLLPGETKIAYLLFSVRENLPKLDLKLSLDIADTAFSDRVLSYSIETSGILDSAKIYRPPVVTLEVPSHFQTISSNKELLLTGTATDEKILKDVFVFVNNKKVFFESNPPEQQLKSLSFKTHLSLNPGYNDVTVFARDQDNLLSHQSLQLWVE